MDLAAAWQSDPGRARIDNEDLSLCAPERGIYAVIDGVGGHASGEVAAAIARRVILERLARPLGTPAEKVREAIALANNQIFEEAAEWPEHKGMTCVLTLALVSDHHVTIGHVGDSRLYKLSRHGIRKLTRDHSPVGEREDAQEISEVEAMRHPRRNEVFRDVGSACRDKDADGFVDVVEEPLEDDSAILLCTDGLSDMVPSSIVEHLVVQHAGEPQAVVDALVAAANDAGGRDNVTVVYAEAPGFAAAVRNRDVTADEPQPAVLKPAESPRSLWLATGVLAGFIAAVFSLWYVGGVATEQRRTLVVGAEGQTYTRIADALAAARPGDVVQLEPGVYKERVTLADGVALVARVTGSATLARDDKAPGAWTALTASGQSGRIAGLRIESTPSAKIDVGMRVSGQGRTIEMIDVDGPMRIGIELADATAITIRGCFIHAAQGTALVVDEASEATIVNNTFIRAGGSSEALSIKDARWSVVSRNLFAGYGSDVVRGLAPGQRTELLLQNFVVGTEPTNPR